MDVGVRTEFLSREQLDKKLNTLGGRWHWGSEGLVGVYQFKNLAIATEFIGYYALQEDSFYTPIWNCVEGKVRVLCCTPEAEGRVTTKDLQVAQRIDRIYTERYLPRKVDSSLMPIR